MKSKEIEYLLFTVKQTDESIYDIGIDLEGREYRIETTDLYGHLLDDQSGGRLRRSKVEQFMEDLAEMNFLSWPQNEKDTLPIHLESASVLYSVDGERFFTTGRNNEDLVNLHKLIEQLIGTTFGSYAFY